MFKKIDLKNKTALVTGAGKGLGKACAIALAEAGAKVIIISRTLSDLDKVEKIIKKTKGSCLKFECDVTDLNKFKSILNKIFSIKPLTYLGKISFELYLIHMAIIYFISLWFEQGVVILSLILLVIITYFFIQKFKISLFIITQFFHIKTILNSIM